MCFGNSLKISRHCLKHAQLKPINLDLLLRAFSTHQTHLASLQVLMAEACGFIFDELTLDQTSPSFTYQSFMQMK